MSPDGSTCVWTDARRRLSAHRIDSSHFKPRVDGRTDLLPVDGDGARANARLVVGRVVGPELLLEHLSGGAWGVHRWELVIITDVASPRNNI